VVCRMGPARVVAAAGELPVTGEKVSSVDRLSLGVRAEYGRADKHVGPVGVDLFLRLRRIVANPPVVHAPERIAPGRGAAGAPQLEGDIVHQ
jgi:hypothetical protein